MTDVCEGPKRLKISWSSLLSWETCRQKAFLMREKKKSPASDIRQFFHGIVADRCMRRWLESDDPREGQMVSWAEEMVESCLVEARDTGDGIVKWKGSQDRVEMTRWIETLLGRLEPVLVQRVLPFDYEPEHRFRVPIRIPDLAGNTSEIDLVGAMDILVRESKEPAVWAGYDLKATANPDYIRKTLGQGIFYDLAVWAKFGTPLRTFEFLLPMVDEQPIVPVSVSNDDRMSLLSRIVQMAHGLWRNDNEPKADSAGCAWCQVRHSCSKFRGTNAGAVWTPKLGRQSAARAAAESAAAESA